MKQNNEVQKALWNVVMHCRDTAATNFLVYANKSKLDVKNDELQKLVALIKTSVEEGYHQASKEFDKKLDKVMTEYKQELEKTAKQELNKKK